MTDFTQLTDEDLWARVNEVSDRDRIEVLVELGDRAFRVGEFARARTLLEEAHNTAEEVGDRRWVAEILYGQGAAAFNAGDVGVAVGCYGQAAQVYCEIGMSREAARALLCQADGHRELDHLEECLAAAREAGGLAESDTDSTLAGEACHLQAAALQRLGRDQETLHACDAGRVHFQQAGCPDRVVQLNDMAITAHLRLGQLDAAQQVARDCLAVARLSEENTSRARYRVAEVLQRRGQHKAALKEAEVAQQEYRKADDLIGVAQCQWLRADALMGLGRHHEALEALEQARAAFDATGQAREALCCQVDQAFAWQVLGNHGEAERINRRLVWAFAALDQESIDAQFSAVRLLANLSAQRRYDAMLQHRRRVDGAVAGRIHARRPPVTGSSWGNGPGPWSRPDASNTRWPWPPTSSTTHRTTSTVPPPPTVTRSAADTGWATTSQERCKTWHGQAVPTSRSGRWSGQATSHPCSCRLPRTRMPLRTRRAVPLRPREPGVTRDGPWAGSIPATGTNRHKQQTRR